MGTREALQMALQFLSAASLTTGADDAAQTIRMLLDQRGCGEIPPGDQTLTDAIDMAVFG